MITDEHNDLQQEYDDIIEEFLRDLPGRFVQLDAALSEFERTFEPRILTDAIGQAHRLRGTGTVFGQSWVSDVAGKIEDHLKSIRVHGHADALPSIRITAKIAAQAAKSCVTFNNPLKKESSIHADATPSKQRANAISGRTCDFRTAY